jgi:phosphoribosyl-ATP pyrophosphohydrolase/phosphoribosyl-AMP cyclohydrolase
MSAGDPLSEKEILSVAEENAFGKADLIPAVVQHWETGKVLMLGYMTREAYEMTKRTGKVTFFSRSRKKIWVKGETSGNGLDVMDIRWDCDQDTILVLAKPLGPTCHTGAVSCFDGSGSQGEKAPFEVWSELQSTVRERKKGDPEISYTASLLQSDVSVVLKKLSEEAFEVSLATLVESWDRQLSEWADLFFHLVVALEKTGLSWGEVMEILRKRQGTGGLVEKKGRKKTGGEL